jgi:ABC-type dipeptide/oligopeptide/nickel transport system permease subunit
MAEARWLARAVRDRRLRTGVAIVGTLALSAALAPWLAPYDPASQPDPVGLKLQGPSLAHVMGTDPFSRDVFSRLLTGSGVSLGIALGAAAIALLLGTAWGAFAGWRGGRTDGVMMRCVDAGLGLPRVLLLILVLALWGSLTPAILALVLGLTGWFATSRLVRAEVRAARSLPHVLAARALGANDWHIFRVHVMPAAAGPALVAAALGASHVLVLEAGLAVIGLGLAPPAASWGTVLYDGFTDLHLYWWLVVFPGAAILLASASLTAVADALREAADPRTPPVP